MGCNACETQWSEVIQFGRLIGVLKADKLMVVKRSHVVADREGEWECVR